MKISKNEYRIDVMGAGGYNKFFRGYIESQDDSFIYLRGSKNNQLYSINKSYIISMTEIK